LDTKSFFVKLKNPDSLAKVKFFDKTITIPVLNAGLLHFDLGLHLVLK
jgi:hypothetical protein